MSVVEIASKEIFTRVLAEKPGELVLDADSLVLGRLASVVAKLLSLGVKVHVVNVEKAVLTGDKKRVINGYKLLFNVKTHKNPYRHGIHRPRNPVTLFKRTVRNMLPKDPNQRLKMLKNVKAYIGLPPEFKDSVIVKAVDLSITTRKAFKYITLAELAKALGWNPRV
jgi:large subunit ribosomal protein L13